MVQVQVQQQEVSHGAAGWRRLALSLHSPACSES